MRQFLNIRRQLSAQGLNPRVAYVVKKGVLVPKHASHLDIETSIDDVEVAVEEVVSTIEVEHPLEVLETAETIEVKDTVEKTPPLSIDTVVEVLKTKRKPPPKRKKTDDVIP